MSWDLKEAVEYYGRQGAPGDQSAVISLLREVQQENGGSIPLSAPEEIAGLYGIKAGFLLALIKRIPSLRLADGHCLELCAGPNCGKRTELAALAEKLCKAHPGKITLKYVPCMRLCGKGPNLRWDGKLYHEADEALLRRLMEENHD